MKIPSNLQELVTTRSAGRCEYCHAPQRVIGQTFHIDRIVPRNKGGLTEAGNLCLACSHGNIAKRDRISAVDPRSRRRVRLFNPRVDQWDRHFAWSRDWRKINGRTLISRATVLAMKMNAPLLQDARWFWRIVNAIP